MFQDNLKDTRVSCIYCNREIARNGNPMIEFIKKCFKENSDRLKVKYSGKNCTAEMIENWEDERELIFVSLKWRYPGKN